MATSFSDTIKLCVTHRSEMRVELWKINFRERLANGGLLEQNKKGGGDASAFSSSVPSVPWRYGRVMFTRRFCGSRTPSSVFTSGELSPFASMAIAASAMPSVTSADFTLLARFSESA